MVTITLYAKQKKRHRCIEHTFGLCGRRRGWDRKEDGLWFLVGNLHGNSDLCIDIILAVAVPGLTGRIVTTGRLFPVSEQYHFPLWRMSLFSCLLVRLPLHTVGGEGSAGDSGSSRSSLCPLPCIGIIGSIVRHLTQARPIKVLL